VLFYLSNRPSSPEAISAQPVAFVMSLEKGQSLHFSMVLAVDGTLTVAGATFQEQETLRQTMGWKVLAVTSKGVATVAIDLSKGSLTANGKTISQHDQNLQIRVASDGRILTGADFGTTSGAGGGPGIPGTDQFMPLLPDQPVAPGDAWTKEFDQAFPFGSGTLHYATHNKLLRYETMGGARVAVIRSTARVPIDITLDVRKLFAALGTPSGLPKGSHPTLSYKGHTDTSVTAWFDPAGKTLQKSDATSTFVMTMRFKGFPKSEAPPGGSVKFAGTISVHLANLG
jgi:hypothetical protein